MTKREQIEEMAVLMTEGARPAMEDAERLYEAGYHKQSEGEWIDVEDTLLYRYKCSLCGEIKLGKMTNYCPNCGAKMKNE